MIFVDANVPMYAAGREHELKRPSAGVLSDVARNPEMFVTDAEILQEILHRYLSLRRFEEGKVVLSRFATIMRERVEPVYARDVERAAQLAENGSGRLSARDFLHAAVMLRVGATRIVSADADFDDLSSEGIERLDPREYST